MNIDTINFNNAGFSRRDFMKASAAAGLGMFLASVPIGAQAQAEGRKRRYANVGVGIRSGMYQRAVNDTYAAHCEMVGYCDTNEGRLKLAQRRARDQWSKEVPIFLASDFDKMIAEQKPDVVIVTTMDSTHHQYIIRAMELGCDVMTEKPMTTDAEKCREIIDAQKKTGKNVRVTFNYRYSPHRTQVKDLLLNGEIGDVMSVDFHWLLDTQHGADYFRRWHGEKKNGGGLMVHKATHHFDLVNWWLSAVPTTVMATGKREYYTPEMARRLGLDSYHERCLTCPEKDKCTFFYDLAGNRGLKELYLDNEQYDGYMRDQCVWNPRINIEDTMNVIAGYDTGATLSYSLNAFNAWEGVQAVFNGTKGRIEHQEVEAVFEPGNDGNVRRRPGATTTRLIPLRGPAKDLEVWTGEGGHGGGDKVMLDDLFLPNPEPDKYKRASDHRGGACSILTGIAANRCFETKREVIIADLAGEIGVPDYPKMPSRQDAIPMPPRIG